MKTETKEIEFNYTHLPLEGLKTAISECYKRLEKWQQTINKLETRKAELRNTKLTRAGTWWKNGVYLYLIYPDVDGKRKREYIGADSKKQNEALEAIERAKEYDRLIFTMQKIDEWIIQAMHQTRSLKETINKI